MRSFLIIIFFVSELLSASAQYPKLIVQLKDKNNSSFNLNNPSQFLSQKAIQKRSKFNIAADSLDLPVSKTYTDSIQLAGNVSILSTSKWLNQVLIQTTDENAITKIKSFPFVKTVTAIGFRDNGENIKRPNKDSIFSTSLQTTLRTVGTIDNTFDYGNSYNQVHIHEGEFLHNKGYHGETMQIAVLDAGFHQYKTISAFDSLRLNNQVLGERDFVAFDNSVNEDDAHGMYCLSILSANLPGKMVGTAPKAKYWLLRTENAATEYPIEEYDWVVGAEFADSAGADIITTSLGYDTFDDPAFNHTYNDIYKNSTTVSKGAAIAVRKGMIVTVSAGNEGGSSWKYITFPADADSVCTVGAINSAGAIASFSSYGYPGKIKPNIVSVGSGTTIAGENNEITTGSGTSFSNPNIAGLIACLWQAFPSVANMKILDAVYKSADKYATPDNRYGYGIPNFKKAYLSLKHDENLSLYSNEWFFASPTPFTSSIDVKFVGQINGPVTLSLINSVGQTIATQVITSEKEEVYQYTFSNLTNLPTGFYSVKYTDSTTTRNIAVQKGNIFDKEWLVALPNPFTSDVAIFIKPQETGEVVLRLIDTKGDVIEVIKQQIIQNQPATIHFKNAADLPAGVYFLQYSGPTQKRTLRLFKS